MLILAYFATYTDTFDSIQTNHSAGKEKYREVRPNGNDICADMKLVYGTNHHYIALDNSAEISLLINVTNPTCKDIIYLKRNNTMFPATTIQRGSRSSCSFHTQ